MLDNEKTKKTLASTYIATHRYIKLYLADACIQRVIHPRHSYRDQFRVKCLAQGHVD